MGRAAAVAGVAAWCALAAPGPSAGFSPAAAPAFLPLRAPRTRGVQVRPTMMLDMSTTLALAQTVNDVAAVPGAASSWYLGELAKNALAVDSATAASLYGLGVCTSSAISRKREPDMVSYVARWSSMGVVDGVCTHSWYEGIQGAADALQLAPRLEPVAMTLFSSLVYTPVYCAAFLFLLSLLEGKGVAGAQARVRADVKEMLWKTTKVWGPTNFLLFALVPLQTRTLVSMGIHYVFLVGLALWDAAIRENQHTAAAGPDTANFVSIGDAQLRLATAFTAVETETDLSLGGDAADLPATDV
jgi:protein Mpv17|eukprot:Tamp_25078.p1 GENE.Tamp_25078~~Tamp_25078.p1  ORF type:complete len:301 (-),score=51.57 Tamp_25078:57-959(-)